MRIPAGGTTFLAAGLLLLLNACGPVYRTTYQLSPPDSARGRSCVNTCQATLQQCEATETYAHEECENRAERGYQACEARKTYEPDPKKGWKKPVCVENCLDCSRAYCAPPDNDKCESRYRDCYVNCGGTVETIVECTSNCDAR